MRDSFFSRRYAVSSYLRIFSSIRHRHRRSPDCVSQEGLSPIGFCEILLETFRIKFFFFASAYTCNSSVSLPPLISSQGGRKKLPVTFPPRSKVDRTTRRGFVHGTRSASERTGVTCMYIVYSRRSDMRWIMQRALRKFPLVSDFPR